MSTWVLLRGLVREQRHWGKFPSILRQEFPGDNIVTLDLPGNGRLYRSASPTHVEEMADFCRSELAHGGLPPPYRVLALSLGAMVAVAWCEQHPDEVEACVLMNTSLRPFSPFYLRLRPHNYPKIFLALLRSVKQRERLILQLTSCQSDKQESPLADWIAFQHEYPVSRRNAFRQLLAAMRFRAPLRKPPPPILVLGSTQDHLVDNRCSQVLAQQWQTASAFHKSAGHDLPLDDGPWIACSIKAWLASVNIEEQPVLHGSSGSPEVIIGAVKLAGKP